ncbi:MAG: hypothetical protein VB118_05860 [Oscillospiraceae bacterium]|nr:hypothetical protein [Oscillospiraceae bacterium]
MNILYCIKKKRGVLMIAAVLMIVFLTTLFVGCETTDNKTHDTTQTDTLETTATVITDKTSFSDTTNISTPKTTDDITNRTTTGNIIDPAETTDTDVQTTQPDTGEETKPPITGKEAEFLSAFRSVYTEAERVYAFYSGYGIIKHGSQTTDINDMEYQIITEPGLSSFNDLKMLTRKYFNEELTKSLINTEINGNHPLFADYNGALYQIGGYVGQWSYDAADNEEYEIIELAETDAVVRVTAYFDDDGRKYLGSYDFHVTMDEEGNICFTDFRLLADILCNNYYFISNLQKYKIEPDLSVPVCDAYKLTFETVNNEYGSDTVYNSVFVVPHLNAETDGANRLNLKIEADFTRRCADFIRKLESDKLPGTYLTSYYTYFFEGDILAIICSHNIYVIGSDAGGEINDCYYFNTKTQTEVGLSDYFAAAGTSITDITGYINSNMRGYFTSYYAPSDYYLRENDITGAFKWQTGNFTIFCDISKILNETDYSTKGGAYFELTTPVECTDVYGDWSYTPTPMQYHPKCNRFINVLIQRGDKRIYFDAASRFGYNFMWINSDMVAISYSAERYRGTFAIVSMSDENNKPVYICDITPEDIYYINGLTKPLNIVPVLNIIPKSISDDNSMLIAEYTLLDETNDLSGEICYNFNTDEAYFSSSPGYPVYIKNATRLINGEALTCIRNNTAIKLSQSYKVSRVQYIGKEYKDIFTVINEHDWSIEAAVSHSDNSLLKVEINKAGMIGKPETASNGYKTVYYDPATDIYVELHFQGGYTEEEVKAITNSVGDTDSD